jgi:hypothetical protein
MERETRVMRAYSGLDQAENKECVRAIAASLKSHLKKRSDHSIYFRVLGGGDNQIGGAEFVEQFDCGSSSGFWMTTNVDGTPDARSWSLHRKMTEFYRDIGLRDGRFEGTPAILPEGVSAEPANGETCKLVKNGKPFGEISGSGILRLQLNREPYDTIMEAYGRYGYFPEDDDARSIRKSIAECLVGFAIHVMERYDSYPLYRMRKAEEASARKVAEAMDFYAPRKKG